MVVDQPGINRFSSGPEIESGRHDSGPRAKAEFASWRSSGRDAPSRSRAGTTITELLVASTIVATLLSLILPALVRTGRLSREMSRHRLALDELSNQLETLSLLPADELAERLESLSVDPLVAAHLPSARLQGELVPSEFGHRLTLRLSWRRAAIETPPIVLTTWVFPVDDRRDIPDEAPQPEVVNEEESR